MKREMPEGMITRIDKRHFAYYKNRGTIYFGKNALIFANESVDFWSIESRGYKTKKAAYHCAEKEIALGEHKYTEFGIAEFTLFYTENEYGCERPLCFKLQTEVLRKEG